MNKKIVIGVLYFAAIVNAIAVIVLANSVDSLKKTQDKLVSGQLPSVQSNGQSVSVFSLIISDINTLASQSAHFKVLLKK